MSIEPRWRFEVEGSLNVNGCGTIAIGRAPSTLHNGETAVLTISGRIRTLNFVGFDLPAAPETERSTALPPDVDKTQVLTRGATIPVTPQLPLERVGRCG